MNTTSRAYESGLEVVLPSPGEQQQLLHQATNKQEADAKAWANYPQVWETNDPELARHDHGIEVVPNQQKEGVMARHGRQPPWWKRRRNIILGAMFGLAVVVAIAVGLGIGLSKKKSPGDKSSSTTSDGDGKSGVAGGARGACSKTFCSQRLTVSATNGGNDGTTTSPELYLARITDDKVLQYRRMTTSPESSSSSFDVWVDDAPLLVKGRPAMVRWDPPGQATRLDFFAVSAGGDALMQRHLQNGTLSDWTAVEDVGVVVSDRLQGCTMSGGGRSDVWYVKKSGGSGSSSFVGHHSSVAGNSTDDPFGFTPDTILDKGAFGTDAPGVGVTCQDANIQSNLVVYDDNGAAIHRQWNVPNSAWSEPVAMTPGGGSRFVDEPFVLDVGPDRFDFLGVDDAGAMHHFNWVGGTLSDLDEVGKGFASAPAAVATGFSGGGDRRIDVVAVGIDGRLKHRSLMGSTWSPEWDDLEVEASGAPLLVEMDGAVHLFVNSDDGRIWYASVAGQNLSAKWNIKDSMRRLD